MNELSVLDCTLRDGGYYNSWVFSLETTYKYLSAIEEAKIDIIEMGFRFTEKNKFIGPFGYCTDQFLSTLPIPKSCIIGVMVNGSDIEGDLPDGMFDACDNSPVDLVRIAIHLGKLAPCKVAAQKIKKMGYKTCVNFMQSGGKPDDQIVDAIQEIKSWGCIDVLYFADSLGNMTPGDVSHLIDLFHDEWQGPVGIHTHNNQGQGLFNSLTALDHNVEYIDGTVLGMGRGAGNTPTEYLLIELSKRGHNYCPDALFSLVIEDFAILQNFYRWGPNLLYYLSASRGIHPTYVQEMLSISCSTPQLLEAIESLQSHASFKRCELEDAILGSSVSVPGSWCPNRGLSLKGKDVLVLANGSQLSHHIVAIEQYIDRAKPLVISLNCDTGIDAEKVDFFAACHYSRILSDSQKYNVLSKSLIVPTEMLRTFQSIDVRIHHCDYGLTVRKGEMEIREYDCTIPSLLVAPYVFAVATQAGAGRLLLAGFDGYEKTDYRHEEMCSVFDIYNRLPEAVPIIAITPTSYPVNQSSVYAL